MQTIFFYRVIRQKDEPFGGIQLIVCGDFLQLPPVTKGEEKRKFCFQVKSNTFKLGWLKLIGTYGQGLHRLEKYLNIEGFFEKYLKIKYALKI